MKIEEKERGRWSNRAVYKSRESFPLSKYSSNKNIRHVYRWNVQAWEEPLVGRKLARPAWIWKNINYTTLAPVAGRERIAEKVLLTRTAERTAAFGPQGF